MTEGLRRQARASTIFAAGPMNSTKLAALSQDVIWTTGCKLKANCGLHGCRMSDVSTTGPSGSIP
jgi:hypothetical protein